MEDKYHRLTASQVELWLNDPVTKYHLLNLENQIKDIEDKVNSGSLRDPHNNDTTCNALSYWEGRKASYITAMDPESLLNHYEMIEVKKDVEETEEEIPYIAPALQTY